MRAALWVAGWLCLVGCAPAEPPDEPARARALDATAQRERQLHDKLPSLHLRDQQADLNDPASAGAMVQRWRTFAREAEGTLYEQIARTRLRGFERQAEVEAEALLRGLRSAYRSNSWAAIDKAFAAFETRWPGTPPLPRLGRAREAIAAVGRQVEQDPLRISVGSDGQSSWDQAHKAGKLTLREIPMGALLRLRAPGSSSVTWRFDLERVPPDATLWLFLGDSWFGGVKYCTISVSINRRMLCSDWELPTGGTENSFPVASFLKPGANELTVTLGPTSLTICYFYRIELSSVRKPAYHTLLK